MRGRGRWSPALQDVWVCDGSLLNDQLGCNLWTDAACVGRRPEKQAPPPPSEVQRCITLILAKSCKV